MDSKQKCGVALVFILSFIHVISCGGQKTTWRGSIAEVDGVTVVKNPREPMYGEDVFSLEEELSIGEAIGREEYMFSEVQSIAVDDEEKIYVLDYEENHVKIFNKNGVFVKQFGRQGQGPGEFYLPRNVIITNQDEILVQNIRSMSFFSLEGEYKREISTAKSMLATASYDSDGNIIGTDIVRDEDKPRYELKKFDPDMNYLYSFGSSPLPSSLNDGFNPFFAVIRWCLINDNQIVFGYMKEYELKIFDAQSNLVRKILKDYVPVKVTQEDVDERLEGEELPPSFKERMTVPEYHCPFRWMISDDESRLFVMTYERVADGEGYYYDIFNSEGRHIAKVPLKTRPYLFKKGKLYTVEEDDDGYHMVKRYKITWKI